MSNQFWKQNRYGILLLLVGTALICFTTLVFYRSDIFIVALKAVFSILLPFVYGFVIAYLLRPVVLRLEKVLAKPFPKAAEKRSGTFRVTASLISLVLMFALLIILILLVLPQLITSISGIIARLPDAVKRFQEWLSELEMGAASHSAIGYVNESVGTITGKLEEYLQSTLLPGLQSAIEQVTNSFVGILGFLKNFGLGCIIAVYFLCSWEKFGMQGKMIVYSIFPQKTADWIRDEVHYVDRMFSGFIIGKIVDSVIMGVICFVFCTLAGMPYAALISVIVGVTNMLPFFGPYLGSIPSTLLVLTEDIEKAVLFLIFIIILQQVDGNVIGPRILGDKLGLSSFWILFSILFFGALWGLPGMLVGAPFFAVIYDLIRKCIYYGLKRRGREDLQEEYQKKY